jgi:hypothetical protein
MKIFPLNYVVAFFILEHRNFSWNENALLVFWNRVEIKILISFSENDVSRVWRVWILAMAFGPKIDRKVLGVVEMAKLSKKILFRNWGFVLDLLVRYSRKSWNYFDLCLWLSSDNRQSQKRNPNTQRKFSTPQLPNQKKVILKLIIHFYYSCSTWNNLCYNFMLLQTKCRASIWRKFLNIIEKKIVWFIHSYFISTR